MHYNNALEPIAAIGGQQVQQPSQYFQTKGQISLELYINDLRPTTMTYFYIPLISTCGSLYPV